MKKIVAQYPVLTFAICALAFQFLVVGILWLRLSQGYTLEGDEAGHMVFRARLFGPLVFAVLISYYLEGSKGLRTLFASFTHWRAPGRYYLLAGTWKFSYTYIGIGILVLFGVTEWPGFFVDDFFGGNHSGMRNLLSNLPFIVGIAFVEETAWMKFSVTRLQAKYSAGISCLLVGVAWGLWYLPMLLIHHGVPDGYPWPIFLLSMVALTFLLGWVYNMTHSGTILLIMQIVSNCAFFILPVLPGWWNGDPTYINAFVAVNSVVAVGLVLIYGWRELGTGKRAVWGDESPTGAAAEKAELPLVA